MAFDPVLMGQIVKPPFLMIACDCGITLFWPHPMEWNVKLVGKLEATCSCGKTISADLEIEKKWEDE